MKLRDSAAVPPKATVGREQCYSRRLPGRLPVLATDVVSSATSATIDSGPLAILSERTSRTHQFHQADRGRRVQSFHVAHPIVAARLHLSKHHSHEAFIPEFKILTLELL